MGKAWVWAPQISHTQQSTPLHPNPSIPQSPTTPNPNPSIPQSPTPNPQHPTPNTQPPTPNPPHEQIGLLPDPCRVATFLCTLATYTATVGALTTALAALCRSAAATTLAVNIVLLMWVHGVGGGLVGGWGLVYFEGHRGSAFFGGVVLLFGRAVLWLCELTSWMADDLVVQNLRSNSITHSPNRPPLHPTPPTHPPTQCHQVGPGGRLPCEPLHHPPLAPVDQGALTHVVRAGSSRRERDGGPVLHAQRWEVLGGWGSWVVLCDGVVERFVWQRWAVLHAPTNPLPRTPTPFP